MSTSYRPSKPIAWVDFWGDLPGGLWREQNPNNTDKQACLTDGANYLWVYTGDCSDISFERYGRNNVHDMLDAIGDKFGVEIISEHDTGFFQEDDRD